MHRFYVLTLIALAALVFGCMPISPAAAPAPTTTTVPTTPTTAAGAARTGTLRFYDLANIDVRDVPLLMAFDDLEAQGYKVEKTYVANSTLLAAALARGDADLSVFNTQTAWKAIGKDAPIKTIAQFTGGTTVLASKSEIRDCGELAGKRVGVAATSGTSPALLDLYLKDKCGGAVPEFIVITESVGRRAALLAGELDAAVMPVEELIKLRDEAPDKYHELIPLSKTFPNVQVDAIHIREGLAQENSEMVKDFLRAMLKANRAVVAEPSLLIDQAVKRLELDAATARKISEAHLANGIWDANGGLTEENVRGTIDLYREIGALEGEIKVEDVADLSFLNAVLDEMGRE